jgi:anti-sigma regulatory factor (Ser/Thr protein kinase)
MELELYLPPVPEVVAVTRAALAQLMRELPDHVTDTACLLVTELITNSLRHSELDGGDRIVLRASVDRDRVRMQVCDPGSRSVPTLQPASLSATWGRGLVLVDTLAREWGVRSNGHTCVWFELDTATSSVH